MDINKPYVIIILFCTLSINSQTQPITRACTYSHVPQLNSVHSTSSLNKNKTDQIDSLLKGFGIERNFRLYTSDSLRGILAYVSVGKRIRIERALIIPAKIFDSIPPENVKSIHSIALMHSIGHHVNEHSFSDISKMNQMHIEADKFSGYHMNKLGWSLDDCLRTIKQSMPGNNSLPTNPATKLRLLAFGEGWNRYSIEQSLYQKKKFVDFYPKNPKIEDSLITVAKEEFKVNPNLSANFFLKAYQYSNGRNLRALYNAYLQFFAAKQFNDALLCTNELLKNGIGFLDEINYVLFYQRIGEAHFAQGNYNKALKFLTIAQDLDSNNSEITRLKSEIFDRQTNTDQLIEELEKTIKIGPASAELFFKLGEAHRRNKNPLEAIKFFKRVLLINPNYINARLALSKLYFKEGKDVVEVMHTTSTNDAINLDYDEIVKTQKKLWSNAESLLKEGLKLHPKDKRLKNELKDLKKAKRNQVIIYPNRTYYTVD
jgi:tetratricopeptide (TPR) repeat protein